MSPSFKKARLLVIKPYNVLAADILQIAEQLISEYQ